MYNHAVPSIAIRMESKCYGFFTLLDSDSDSKSECKPISYIVMCRTLQILIQTSECRNRI